MSADYTRLKGFDEYGENLISSQVLHNVVSFFNWGLLGKGAFYNVEVPTSGIYGGDFSRLRPVSDPRYGSGTVWASNRNAWVWESGVDYGIQPTRFSGVYVNSVFQPLSGVGPYAHTVNYEYGQVTFASSLPVSTTVSAPHSFRAVPVVSLDAPWFKRILTRTLRPDDSDNLAGSGYQGALAENRFPLPAIGVEVGPTADFVGMQLGGGQWFYPEVYFHVLAETAYERNHIINMICLQNEKRIRMFDTNEAPYPLDANGMIAAGAKTYPDLVKDVLNSGYFYKILNFKEIRPYQVDSLNHGISRALVVAKCEINMDEI